MSEYPPSSDPWSGAPAPVGPPLASWGQRVAGALIDGLIAGGIWLAGVIIASILGAVSEALGVFFLTVGALGSIVFFFWNLVQQGKTGQTVGKKAMRIRLVRLDGVVPPGVGLSIGRAFLHVVDQVTCYLGYLWPLWDEKRQTFSDKILNTVVVVG